MYSVLLAGATGAVGGAVLGQAWEFPEKISRLYVLARSPLNMDTVVDWVVAYNASAKREEVLEWYTKTTKVLVVPDFEKVDEVIQNEIDSDLDVCISCLGTTMAKAKSPAAFRHVDFDYNVAIAKAALTKNARRYMLCSSGAASPKSFNFYLKVKGQLEEEVKKLPFDKLSIFRPSLLITDRKDTRIVESILQAAAKVTDWNNWWSISAELVARAMLATLAIDSPRQEVVSVGEMLKRIK